MIFHKSNVGREVIVDGRVDTILKVSSSGEWVRLKSEENDAIAREYWANDIQYARLLTLSFGKGVFHDVALCRQDYVAPKEETVLPKEEEAAKGFKPKPKEPVVVETANSVTGTVIPDGVFAGTSISEDLAQ